jgi:DNA-binding PucR family transcriptional regulator
MLLRRASRNISLQLSATRRAAGEDWEAGEALTNGLIRGNAEAVALQQRADLLRVRLDVPRVVCILRPRPTGERDPVQPGARRLLETLSVPGLSRPLAATTVGGESVVLLAVPTELTRSEQVAWLSERVSAKLRELSDGGLLAALSTVAQAPSDYIAAYEEALQVMRCLEGFGHDTGSHILTADEFGPGQLFILSAAGGEQGRRFAQKTLGALLDPDSPKMRELLSTLIAFSQASHKTREAAEALHVHKNTVLYRLTRIQEVTGLDVADDVNAQIAANMSLTILRLGGELPIDLSRV